MNMSKLSKIEKDLRSSAKLNNFQALKLKGGNGNDKREDRGGSTSGGASTGPGSGGN